ncbi:MAG: 30S ribosomal protein S1, partial [Pedobacter sp.]
MSDNNIVNPNAEGQESAPVAQTEATAATTATTNAPDAPEATAASTVENTVPVKAPVEERVVTAHDDFDWSVDKRNVAAYSQEEKEKYDKVYENTFVQLNDGELIKGLVVGITKTDVVLNIGFKSDGLVSLNEFRDIQGLKVGDEVEVMVVEKEDRDGNLN